MASSSSTSAPVQVKGLAFTIRNLAMEDGWPRDALAQEITAYTPTSTSYNVIVDRTPQEHSFAQVFRIGSAFTDRERGPPGEYEARYIVVGYALTCRVANRPVPPPLKKQRPVGLQAPDAVMSWEVDGEHTLVVASKLNSNPEKMMLYALVYPHDGLFTPCPIETEAVYYRHEFRTNETVLKSRGPEWNRKVAEHTIQPGGVDDVPTRKHAGFKNPRNPALLTFAPEVVFEKEFASLLACYKQDRNPERLQELKDLIEAFEPGLKHRPDNACLRSFFEPGPFELDDARQFCEAFTALWPETTEVVTPERVLIIKLAVEAYGDDIFISYHLLRAFVYKTSYWLSEHDSQKEELGPEIPSMIADLERTLGPASDPPVSARESGSVQAPSEDLLIMLKTLKAFEDELKDYCGDSPFPDNVHQLWATYADSCDSATARAAFRQVVKTFIGAFRQAMASARERAHDEALRKLKTLGLSDNASTKWAQ